VPKKVGNPGAIDYSRLM